MRVLFLTHPEADYGEALLYRGLVNVLGGENVIDYPWKPTYHGVETHTYALKSVPHLPDHAGHTAKHPWFKPVDTPQRNFQDILRLVQDRMLDITVFGSLRAGIWTTWEFFHGLGVRLPQPVVTDHEDGNLVYIPAAVDVGSPVFFKRELFQAYTSEGVDVLPLPFSCAWGDSLPPGNPHAPRTGAFLSCSKTHPARDIALKAMADAGHVTGENAYHGGDFATAMQAAAVGVSVRGHGVDTLRQWEIPFFGAALLTDSTILTPDDFFANEDCFRYSNHADLGAIVQRTLAHPNLPEVAAKGQRRLLRHHTHTARAEYFLGVVEQYLRRR